MYEKRRRRLQQGGLVLAAALTLCWSGCDAGGSGEESLDLQYQSIMRIAEPDVRSSRLLTLARKQRAQGDALGANNSLAAALDSAGNISDSLTKARELCSVAALQAEWGAQGEAADTLKLARAACRDVAEADARVPLLVRIAKTYGKVENATAAKAYLEEAQTAAEGIEDAGLRIEALISVTGGLWATGQDAAAESLKANVLAQISAAEAESPRQAADRLADFAAMLAAAKQSGATEFFAEAAKIANALKHDDDRAYALLYIAEKQARSGNKGGAAQTLESARAAADRVTDRSMQGPLFEKIDSQRSKL